MNDENSKKMVRRNLTLEPELDDLAESLAIEYKLKGGVSELARNLIKALAENPEQFEGVFKETRRPLKSLIKDVIRELEQEKSQGDTGSARKKR